MNNLNIRIEDLTPFKTTHKPLVFQKENRHKLGKIAHFSTMPYDTCIQKCEYCYSVKSVNQYPNVKTNYTHNQTQLDRGVKLPDVPKGRDIVRMYLSGDFQSIYVISEWIRLARENKNVIFYGYTKQWKSKEEGFLPMLNILKSMTNVVLRASVDNQIGHNIPNGWVRAGILEQGKPKGEHFICKSNKSNGLKCDTCKICFMPKHKDKEIYFPAH